MKNKEIIEKSVIFDIVRKMPKGVLHHQHLDCTFDLKWLVPLLCKDDIVYINPKDECKMIIVRKEADFEGIDDRNDYVLLSEYVKDPKNRTNVDKHLTCGIDEILGKWNMWQAFNDRLNRLIPVLFNVEFFHDYVVNTCIDCVNDGIDRLECRFLFGGIKDKDGKPISMDDEIAMFRSALKIVNEKYPHFTFGIIA